MELGDYISNVVKATKVDTPFVSKPKHRRASLLVANDEMAFVAFQQGADEIDRDRRLRHKDVDNTLGASMAARERGDQMYTAEELQDYLAQGVDDDEEEYMARAQEVFAERVANRQQRKQQAAASRGVSHSGVVPACPSSPVLTTMGQGAASPFNKILKLAGSESSKAPGASRPRPGSLDIRRSENKSFSTSSPKSPGSGLGREFDEYAPETSGQSVSALSSPNRPGMGSRRGSMMRMSAACYDSNEPEGTGRQQSFSHLSPAAPRAPGGGASRRKSIDMTNMIQAALVSAANYLAPSSETDSWLANQLEPGSDPAPIHRRSKTEGETLSPTSVLGQSPLGSKAPAKVGRRAAPQGNN